MGCEICKEYKVVIKFDLQMQAIRGNRETVPVRGGASPNAEPFVQSRWVLQESRWSPVTIERKPIE